MKQLLRRAALIVERRGPLGGLKLASAWPRLREARTFQLLSYGPSQVGRQLEKEQKISYLELGTSGGLYTRWGAKKLQVTDIAPHVQACIEPPAELRAPLIRAGIPLVEENTTAIRTALNSPLLRAKIATGQLRELLRGEHDAAGMPLPLISVVVSTNRPDQLEHVRAQFSRQTYPRTELLILTHGFHAEGCLHKPAEASLGECLNELVAHAAGKIIAKFDDDDLYLPNYLTDQYLSMWDTGAKVVGKAANYIYFPTLNAIALRRENRARMFTDFVAGATLMADRDILEQFPFAERTRGEDTDFLRRVAHAGVPIYSTDQFNFMVMRHDDHTWNATDLTLAQSADIHTFGLNEDHVRA
ncbi:glycosyltransferase family 2 protein [Corynebacterium renale]|uniref:Glycosyl transferase family 2 n=1 Tax=Corynebacterium renale TaxID=1724 RepID=A0A2A9DMB7_9CORY|nr:glycosyltransferase family 2 protein [Corynebacterium renale]PFG27506.1 hypothetical protein ATK06_0567 [Corynebacterium renale]SQI23236.1 Uncharacterised protein [Corynebacterium renale]